MTKNKIKNVVFPDFLSGRKILHEYEITELIGWRARLQESKKFRLRFPEGNPFACIGFTDRGQPYEIYLRNRKLDLEVAEKYLSEKGYAIKEDKEWTKDAHLQLAVVSGQDLGRYQHGMSFTFRGGSFLDSAYVTLGDPKTSDWDHFKLSRSMGLEILSYIAISIDEHFKALDKDPDKGRT